MRTALTMMACWFGLSAQAAPLPYRLYAYDMPPFAMVNDGEYKGIAVDIVRTLFSRTQIAYQFDSAPLARGMMKTEYEERTCVFPVQRAQDIEANFTWISPILVTRSGLFMNREESRKLLALGDAKRYTVGALRGSGDAEYLKKFGFNVTETNTQEGSLLMLLSRRFDMLATDSLSARYMMKRSAGAGPMPVEVLTYRTSLGSIACNANMPRADVERLQKTLDHMIRDGTLKKLTSAAL